MKNQQTENPYLKAIFWFDLDLSQEQRKKVCERYPNVFFGSTSRTSCRYSDLLSVFEKEFGLPENDISDWQDTVDKLRNTPVEVKSKEISLDEILAFAVKNGLSHQLHFIDYSDSTFTVPSQLTADRLQKAFDDKSVDKIRIEFKLNQP